MVCFSLVYSKQSSLSGPESGVRLKLEHSEQSYKFKSNFKQDP